MSVTFPSSKSYEIRLPPCGDSDSDEETCVEFEFSGGLGILGLYTFWVVFTAKMNEREPSQE
jgi:hypothetical protein